MRVRGTFLFKVVDSMAQYDGSIRINTNIDTDGLKRGESEIKGSMDRILSSAKRFAGIIGLAFSVGKLVQFGKEAIELGSDLEEVQNVVDVTFTTMSENVNEFAKNAAISAGLSETMAKQYVGTFGAMSKSFGFTEEEAYKMSTALTQLSGDVASFYNITQGEAYTKLKSVFTGETETLKELGVVMTQNALDAYAMANGFGKTTSAMAEQEKVALRLRFVQDQLSAASGDFVRTSDSWANQVRIMQLQISSLKATVGQGLINVFTPVLRVINILLAKLATVANAFRAFTELITGRKSEAGSLTGISGDVEAGYNEAAEGAENLAAANDDVAKSAGKAEKAAKGQISALDNLNNLTSSSGSGGGGGTGDSIDFGELAEGETVLDKVNDSTDALLGKLKELRDIFIQGFWDGLGGLEYRLESIKNSIASIKNSLIDIWTDPAVLSSADLWAQSVSYMLGSLVGSLASIGLTIATNLLGGISTYLEQNGERIRNHLISMFDIRTEINNMFAELFQSFAYVFEAFAGEQGQQLTANLIGIFVDAFMGIRELASKLFRDLINIIIRPFVDNKEAFRTALEGFLGVLAEITGTIKQGIDDTFDKLNEVYDEHFKPFFDSIADGLSDTVGKFMEFWNGSVQPILNEWAKGFDELWKSHIQPMLNKFVEMLGDVADLLKVLWENVLKPIIDWIVENILPILLPIIDGVVKSVGFAASMMADTIGGLFDFISGILKFLTNVFSVNWSSVWDGVKNTVINAWNWIVGTIVSAVQTIVGWISDLFSIFNQFSGKASAVSGAAGGAMSGSFPRNSIRTSTYGVLPQMASLELPPIPKLATGAVIPANKEFLAVLGDQKHGRNLEAPEDLIRQIVREESGNSGGEIVVKVPVSINEQVIFEIVQRLDRERFNRTGRPSFQM